MRRKLKAVGLTLLVLVLLVGPFIWYQLFRVVPVTFAANAALFKYGSVGVEEANGMPYWVWRVLPTVFPDKVGDDDGYRAFGFLWEPGEETPIGLPRMTVGFSRLGINCGLCHIGSYRSSEIASPQLLMGAPNTTLDIQRYLRFLFACANDPRFSADNLLPAITAVHPLSPTERVLYRFIIIPQTRRALLKQQADLWWMDHATAWGPGRSDPFNPAKVQILHRPYDGTVGNSDTMPLWNFRARAQFGLHWDGLNTSLDEIVVNSAIGNGASGSSINRPNLGRIQAWIQNLKPPAYPFDVKPELAAQGGEIYRRLCADCHDFGGSHVGTPLPIEWIGTDRSRFDSWTEEAKTAFNALDGYDWTYTHFRKTSGYASVPLDGLWARAPYLHNGSVPTLWDLLSPEAARPVLFYRGYDVYDSHNVGFDSTSVAAKQHGQPFDTRLPANGNQGHLFGTDLLDDEKWALIEYLKTL